MMKIEHYPAVPKSWFKAEKPLKKISLFFRRIKYNRQRIKYGWSEPDTWNMDVWFLNVVPPMLKHLRDNQHGHPGTMTADEWNKILNRMICLFEACNEDHEEEIYDKYHSDRKKFIEELLKEDDRKEKCKNEAFALFSKHFWDLWD